MADEDFRCTLKDYDKFSPNFAMPFPFPFPVIPGNNNVSFPFPNFGNGIFYSRSRSRTLKSHSRSPLPCLDYVSERLCQSCVGMIWLVWFG